MFCRSLPMIYLSAIALVALLSPPLLVSATNLWTNRASGSFIPPDPASSVTPTPLAPHWEVIQLGESAAEVRPSPPRNDEIAFHYTNYLPGPARQTTLSLILPNAPSPSAKTLSIELRAETPRRLLLEIGAYSQELDLGVDWSTHEIPVPTTSPLPRLQLHLGAHAGAIFVRRLEWK